MNQAMNGEPMTIFGDGTRTRAVSHVDDVAPTFAGSVNVKSAYDGVFDIGADIPHKILEVTHAVSDSLGVEPRLLFLPARNEVLHPYSSHEKGRRVFGQGPGVGLREVIARMATRVHFHGVEATAGFAHMEIIKNMPPSWASQVRTDGN